MAGPAGPAARCGRRRRRRDRRRRPPARPRRSRPTAARAGLGGVALGGLSVAWLTLIVLIPLAAVVSRSLEGGLEAFWASITNPQAVAALRLTLIVSLVVAAIDAVMGTLIAWVLVRDDFRGKRVVNAVIDLPFALADHRRRADAAGALRAQRARSGSTSPTPRPRSRSRCCS